MPKPQRTVQRLSGVAMSAFGASVIFVVAALLLLTGR
jgi:hypothetical protein